LNTTKKQIHDALSEIEAPASLYEFACNVPHMSENELTESLASNASRTKKGRSLIKPAAVTAATFGLIIGSGFFSPAVAQVLKEVPLLGSLFEQSASLLTKEAVNKGYVNEVQKSAEDNGIKIDISEVYFDGMNLSIGYTVHVNETRQKWRLASQPLMPWITLDGKEQDYSWTFEELEETDRTSKGIMHVSFQSQEAKTLQMKIDEVYGNKGEWSFHIPVENRAVHKDTSALNSKVQKRWAKGNNLITVETVVVKPGHTDIIFSQKTEAGKKAISLQDTGVALYDEEGTILSQGYRTPVPGADGTFIVSYPEIKKLPDNILLSLCETGELKLANDPAFKHYEFSSTDRFPADVPVTEKQKIVIQSIEETNKDVKVTFEIKGDISLQQQYMIIRDQQGMTLHPFKMKRVDTDDGTVVFEQEYKKEPGFSGRASLQLSVDKDDFIRDYLRIEVPVPKN
jgi:hypothetical protein